MKFPYIFFCLILSVFALVPVKSENDINHWISQLKNVSSREEAKKKLAQIGRAAVPRLLDLVEDQKASDETKQAAIYVIGEIGDPSTKRPLLELLEKNRANSLAVFIIQSLADLRAQEAVDPLIKLLADKKLRNAAALALGEIGDSRATQVMCQLFKDSPRSFRKCLTIALGNLKAECALSLLLKQLSLNDQEMFLPTLDALHKIGNRRAVPHILATLAPKNPEFYTQSLWTLGEFRSHDAIPALTKAISDSRYRVSSTAIEALGKIGDLDSLYPLYDIAQKPDSYLAEEAIEAIEKISHPQAVHMLLDLANSHANSFLRWKAGQSVVKMQSAAIPLLLDELSSKATREKAVELLIRIGKPAIPELKKKYRDDLEVQEAIVFILGEIADEEALDFLENLLQQANTDARKIMVVQAIGKLSSSRAIKILHPVLKQSDNTSIRKEIVIALAKSRDQKIVPELLQYFQNHEVTPELIRSAALYSQEEIANALVKLLKTSEQKDIIYEIAHSLKHVPTDLYKSIAHIAKARKFPEKVYVIGLLARLNDSKATRWLLKKLKDKNETIRQLVVSEMVTLPPKQNLPYLIPLLQDKNTIIQVEVRELLRKISNGKDFGDDIEKWQQWYREFQKQ